METHDRLTPASADSSEAAPERRCILTHVHGPRARLIRLALAPDGMVVADLGEKLPGRGAWLSADRALLETAAARGKLRGALARAFKSNVVTVPDDLSAQIGRGLERRSLDRLGLENRGGNLIWGHERIGEALLRGRVRLLMHVADARPDGVDKLESKRRAVTPDTPSRRLPIGRDGLSVALGRENIVHAAITSAGGATRVLADLDRWMAFTGQPDLCDANKAETAVAVPAGERH